MQDVTGERLGDGRIRLAQKIGSALLENIDGESRVKRLDKQACANVDASGRV